MLAHNKKINSTKQKQIAYLSSIFNSIQFEKHIHVVSWLLLI